MIYGLKKTEYDPRDFSHQKTFGSMAQVLPDEYIVGSCPVKNQMGSEFCTAFASYVLAALEDVADYSPEWFFAKEVEETGQTDGQDLRTSCKVATKYGFLPQNMASMTTLNQSPTFLSNPANWPFSDDLAAANNKRESYYRCDGTFEQIKQTLFRTKRAILTGITWYESFTYAPNGIVPEDYTELGGLHCIPIIGFKKINGVDYLVVQNSYGDQIGDKGLFYFSEVIFNKVFTEPFYIFVPKGGQAPEPIGNFFEILIFNLLKFFKR